MKKSMLESERLDSIDTFSYLHYNDMVCCSENWDPQKYFQKRTKKKKSSACYNANSISFLNEIIIFIFLNELTITAIHVR